MNAELPLGVPLLKAADDRTATSDVRSGHAAGEIG
jgi:hypothetical protein